MMEIIYGPISPGISKFEPFQAAGSVARFISIYFVAFEQSQR